ncbi:tudor and KH domain-containing protein-like [Anneissia japonica]|uniref:tudor and KH domain-containing protein-like n=1 Tax=Anneissia japonica TaxID=1529436 RepID=UPI0014257709|nr:tudor and KH domain-containing protein-like [Anneissia japonica]
MGLTNRQIAALVVTVPLSAFFLYLLFKKQDEEDDFPENTSKSVASGQQTVVEIKVPDRCASFIIGRDGANIRQSDRLNAINPGDIVAAPFQHDDNWYRAKVVGFLDDGLVDIYYVDYGDNGSVHHKELKALRSDFLGLPHQATECCLAGVQPIDGLWSETAINTFEELTYCAQWKPLMAKVMSYKSTENGTLPCLELVDTNKEEDVLIASKMIETGVAIKEVKPVTEEHTLFPCVDDTAKMIQEAPE